MRLMTWRALCISPYQAAVVGVTCRHDATTLLEKRVKSRFSHRRVMLAPPGGRMRAAAMVRTALALPLPSAAEAAVAAARPAAAAAGAAACKAAGWPPSAVVAGVAQAAVEAAAAVAVAHVDVYPPEPGYAKRFNAALDSALSAPACKNCLKVYENVECNPRAFADLALLALSRMVWTDG